MKKNILLLAVQVLLFCANAQKIDKTLIYGRWNAHAVSGVDIAINTDSLKQSQTAMINAAIALAPSHLLSEEDSLDIIKKSQALSKKVDSSYLKFKKDGKYASLTLFAEGDSEAQVEEGTFKWLGNDQIIITNSKTSEVFTIKALTPTNLSIIGNDDKPAEKYQVRFKKR